ncbi:MAG: hypothetical protein LH478_00490 [Chitinophagaceae bacterium]|nr:hypothetical protein [Chitinophagaceae bacterium]
MNNIETKLFIFPLTQSVVINADEKKLVCNIVVMPRFSPLLPLVPGAVPFSESAIAFDAFLVKDNEQLPLLQPHDERYSPAEVSLREVNADRKDLFTQVGSFFQISANENFGRKIIPAAIKKYLPEAYRKAYGFAGTRQGAVTDDSYFCALKENSFAKIEDPDRDTVNWAQVMAFCLHQPELARQLGMLYQNVEINLPDAAFFKDGGWLYLNIKENTSYADLPEKNIQRYAAWIPAVTTSRTLFSPVVFPVEGAAPGAGTFDDVFDELLRYNDGFAKIVHASQPVSTNHLGEQADGTAPVTDMGIRLAWDDEQVLEWYNRGFQSQAKISGAGVSDTPLMVSRYRVDVADAEADDIFLDRDVLEKKLKWKSQVSVRSDEVKAGNINLGSINTELGVQVLPAKHGDKGDYWLPAYFANWNGTSLCLPDPLPEKLNQLDDTKRELVLQKGGNPDDIPKMMYEQPVADKVHLKYGNTYAFRVRLSDISGGGPGPDTTSLNRGEHKIAIQKFKRFVAPQPPALTIANNGQSLTIGRPRLNYPAIMFTDIDQQAAAAADELLLDRQHLIKMKADHEVTPNRKWLREVSLPDPDVTQVEIVVEIKSLDMDREDSYHAIKKISPKEPFVFLYKTLRSFPAYELNHDRIDDVIDLNFSYQDISLIRFLAPDKDLGFAGDIHSDNGPLLLPTARDIRLTIRSFCPKEKPDYFGSEESKSSIPVIQTLRQDPVKLEEAILLKDAKDPLLSIFFLPQPAITAQLRTEQKMRGKGNETDLDLLDRLSAVTGLVHKNGSILGSDNIRTQMGCSALINHSVSPDHSSITFSSRDDFYHKWINVIQLDLNRDWTWDLLKPDSFKVFRQWKLDGDEAFQPKEELGGIFLTKGLNWQAMDSPGRSFTRLIFFDAIDPKPVAGKFPQPLEVNYFIEPQFKQIKAGGVQTDLEFDAETTNKKLGILLPVTTVPAQVPKIVSVGIALSADSADEELIANQYSQTAIRNRYLWVEFDRPLADENDLYFGRVLAYSPDRMLAAEDMLRGASLVANADGSQRLFNAANPNLEEDWKTYLLKEQSEPPINLDPEPIRIVRPLQPFDQSGLDAMQPMTAANSAAGEKPVHFLLPLPPGLYPDSEDLFGFFTYEFRVGHNNPKKWCTAQGRFGSPLRQPGVQHPAPPMLLSTVRDRGKILVSTRHAQSFFNGRNLTPVVPRTDIYGCLYAQVLQADGIHYRNILIDRMVLLKPSFTSDMVKINAYNQRKKEQEDVSKPFTPPEPPVLLPGTPPYAVGFYNLKNVQEKLRYLGIDENASLSVLSIELMPPNNFYERVPFEIGPPLEAQELSLDKVRILRTSRLSAVTDTCAVEV